MSRNDASNVAQELHVPPHAPCEERTENAIDDQPDDAEREQADEELVGANQYQAKQHSSRLAFSSHRTVVGRGLASVSSTGDRPVLDRADDLAADS